MRGAGECGRTWKRSGSELGDRSGREDESWNDRGVMKGQTRAGSVGEHEGVSELEEKVRKRAILSQAGAWVRLARPTVLWIGS